MQIFVENRSFSRTHYFVIKATYWRYLWPFIYTTVYVHNILDVLSTITLLLLIINRHSQWKKCPRSNWNNTQHRRLSHWHQHAKELCSHLYWLYAILVWLTHFFDYWYRGTTRSEHGGFACSSTSTTLTCTSKSNRFVLFCYHIQYISLLLPFVNLKRRSPGAATTKESKGIVLRTDGEHQSEGS